MKAIVLFLSATTLAFGGTCAYLWQQAGSDGEQIDVLQARVQELERSTAAPDISNPQATLTAEQSPLFRSGRAETAVAPRAPSGPGEKRQAAPEDKSQRFKQMRSMAERQRRLMQNPEYRAAMRAQQRLHLRQTYSDAGDVLGLESAEIDKLLDLLAEHQTRMTQDWQFHDPAGPQPDERAMAEAQRKMADEQRRQRTEIAALLGEPKFAAWEDYQRSMGARIQVRELRNLLGGSSNPLREDQIQPLVSVIANEEQRAMKEMQEEMSGRVRTPPVSRSEHVAMQEQMIEHSANANQRMHDALAPYLSAAQLERYDQILNQQLEMHRLSLAMLREQVEAEARGEVPPTEGMVFGATQMIVSEPTSQP